MTAAGQERVNPQAAVLADFNQRIDAYLALRKDATRSIGSPEETKDPGEITHRQRARGEAIRQARRDAKPGAILTADVADLIRQAVREDFGRRTAEERRAAMQALPSGVKLGVNDFYPSELPLGTVPPRLLLNLPRLPEELEYRFIGRQLILRDIDANLVIDIVPGVLPPGQ